MSEAIFGIDLANQARWDSVIDYMKPIENLYQDDNVSEIMINRFDNILIQTPQGVIQTENKFDSEAHLKRFVTQVAGALGQSFNEKSPILDARFPDDTRLCCVSDDVSPKGINVTMRIARSGGGVITPERMIDNGYMTPEMWHFLVDAYSNGKNIIFSGNTGSGKTSMMRNLISSLNHQERILIVEDTNEINIEHPNVINMEAADKRDSDITMEKLIQTTLRQFGSKLVVGEIREATAANALIQAINTGVSGCTGSLHANNVRAAVKRLQYLLATLGYVSFDLAGTLIMSSIDIFVHCNRCNEHGRRITEISLVDDNRESIVDLFTFNKFDREHIKHDANNAV